MFITSGPATAANSSTTQPNDSNHNEMNMKLKYSMYLNLLNFTIGVYWTFNLI